MYYNLIMNKKIILILSLIIANYTDAQCWKDVSQGLNHSKALKDDGTLWSWAGNHFGQMGNGSTGQTVLTPLKIGTDTNWKTISAGNVHTVALKSDNSLWAWGDNERGEVGNGTNVPQYTPIKIGSDKDWKAIASNDTNTKALKTDGSLWAWGINFYGALGDGTNIDRTAPVRVGSDKDWKFIAKGPGYHSIAIKNDGSLWAWGSNEDGQLGDGTKEHKNIPIQIGSDTDWKIACISHNRTLAIKNDGSLWAWGDNYSGLLGDGTTVSKYTPTKIGNDTDWLDIAGGLSFNIAIKNDGSLWSWGLNANGELGDGTNVRKYVPTKVGTLNDWKSIMVGYYAASAIKNDGSLWSWGWNGIGLLGDGTTVDSNIPVKISCSTTLSVSDISNSTIQIYPNPSKDYFIINTKEVKQVQLYSLDGKLIKEYSASEKYSVGGLSKGIYLLKIQLQNGKVISEKIIKE